MYDRCRQACRELAQGRDASAQLARLEPELGRYFQGRMKKLREDDSSYQFAYEYRLYPWDALYGFSAAATQYWDAVYPFFRQPQARYAALLRFVNARELFLGIPHWESVRLLEELGWTPADVMAAHLENRHSTSTLALSPDAVAQAAKQDPDTALRLMEREGKDLLPNGMTMYQQFEWIDFLYYVLEYPDRAFLSAAHKSKRLCQHCQQVLEKLKQPAALPPVLPWQGVPDFSRFRGAVLRQKHLMASAAGQRLRKGNENNGYYVCSFHLMDEDRGLGAALRFQGFNKAPEYGNEERPCYGACLYQFRYPMLFDHVPESWRREPGQLPEDFVTKAYRAFSKLAGWQAEK